MYTKFINAVLVAAVLVVSLMGSASAKKKLTLLRMGKHLSHTFSQWKR